MNLAVDNIDQRGEGDPDYADYWLTLYHTETHISWEVPLTKEEAAKMSSYFPKEVREKFQYLQALEVKK